MGGRMKLTRIIWPVAILGAICAGACVGVIMSAAAAGAQQSASTQSVGTQQQSHRWAIVVHGGAGVIERKSMTPEREAEYRAGMKAAIEAGEQVLERGGSSLDAVEATIRILEDDPNFNAGHGAVFAADGTNQLDAAIMDGATLKAGAVADVTRTRHPISLARAVMEKSPHVFLVGPGAGRSQLLFHRAPLAVADQTAQKRRTADSPASRRRAAGAQGSVG